MKFRSNLTLIISLVAMLAICIIVSVFGVRGFLEDNVYPVDEMIDSYYWTELYIRAYWGYLISSSILNIVFIVCHKSKTPQKKWSVYMIIDIIIALVASIPFFVIYPIDDVVIHWGLTFLLTILTNPVAFFISTYFAPWDFNPFVRR